jgi:hypothetical protein
MTTAFPSRRLALIAALALTLCALAAALLGATSTLAQTRRAACAGAAAHAKHESHGCGAGKGHRASGRRGRHKRRKGKRHGKRATHALIAARCADGSLPVLGAESTFVCDDGSEPQCESGATPLPTSNGQQLVCPIIGETETGAGEAECEEAEEEENEALGQGEQASQACEIASGETPS